jgi:hypothetical protein
MKTIDQGREILAAAHMTIEDHPNGTCSLRDRLDQRYRCWPTRENYLGWTSHKHRARFRSHSDALDVATAYLADEYYLTLRLYDVSPFSAPVPF